MPSRFDFHDCAPEYSEQGRWVAWEEYSALVGHFNALEKDRAEAAGLSHKYRNERDAALSNLAAITDERNDFEIMAGYRLTAVLEAEANLADALSKIDQLKKHREKAYEDVAAISRENATLRKTIQDICTGAIESGWEEQTEAEAIYGDGSTMGNPSVSFCAFCGHRHSPNGKHIRVVGIFKRE